MVLDGSKSLFSHLGQFLRCNLRILSDLVFDPFIKNLFLGATLSAILSVTLGATLSITLGIMVSDTPHYENDVPFEVPSGWEWCIVDDFAYVASGSTPSKDSFVEEGVPYIKMYNLRNQKIDFDFHPQYVKREVHEGKLQRSKTEVGDLIMNIVGPPLGKLAIIPPSLPESNFNQAAVLIRPYLYKDVLVKYLFYYLSEMSEINSISTKGTAGQVNISLTQSQNMRIALPPYEEQKRIIKTVENLFQTVDIIDKGSVDITISIGKVKSKILDLAFHGKLVPQDSNDEPAIELLKRINPKFSPCDNAHYPFDVPNNWTTCQLGDIYNIVSAKRVHKSEWQHSGIPFYRAREIVKLSENGEVDNDLFITKEHYSGLKKKYGVPRPSDIMISAVGTIGKTYIVKADDVFYYKDASVICLQNINDLYSPYISILLSSHFLQEQIFAQSKGTTVDTITIEKANSYMIPFPPIKEQQRIVAKIEELFAVLDEIQKSIEA